LIHYFAYGANMAEAELGSFVPKRRFLGPARLRGFRLAFRRRSIRWGGGAADILESPGDEVWGALFELPEDALDAVDAKEGRGVAYRRREVKVALGDDNRRAFTYEVIDKEPADVAPTHEYVALLVGGARDHGLPDSYVERLERLTALASADP
jgi:gamma-glutamylcyclotransferase